MNPGRSRQNIRHELRALAELPVCRLGIRETADGRIEEIAFLAPDTRLETPASPLAEIFIRQLEHYLADPRYRFSLPLAQGGSPFQLRVWQSIRAIPAGSTRHYGELAQALGSAARAVGQACGANPHPLVTPCHRVMAKTGLGGFAHARGGWLLETKRWLLRHEGVEA